jgi:hypothetical protein
VFWCGTSVTRYSITKPHEAHCLSTFPTNDSRLQPSISSRATFSSLAQSTATLSTLTSITSDSSVNVPSTDLPRNQSYLELCIKTSQRTKIIFEIDLKDIKTNMELWARIRREYFRLRKPRSNLWFLKPSGIEFVKVCKVRNNLE